MRVRIYRVLLSTALCVFALSSPAADTVTAAADGEQLYLAHCAQCHGGKVAKAPPLSLLQIMSGSSILRAMESGVMQTHAAAMNGTEKRAVARYLTGMDPDNASTTLPAPRCEGDTARFDFKRPPATEGWGVGLHNQRHFGAKITELTAESLPQLELKWAIAFPEAIRARSQPTVAGGAVYVGSQNGTVYALDRDTGCIRWTFSTVAEVRTAIVVTPWEPGQTDNPLLYFGDLVGNVYAVDAVTGELAWRDRPDDHASLTLTAAPALYDGKLFVPLSALEVTAAADPTYACCTFRGGVAAYDALTGEKLWVGYTIDEAPKVVGKNAIGTDRIAPSGAPVWNTPAIDPKRGVMYVGTGENYSSPANDTSDAIIALSLTDGKILWHRQMTPRDAWNMGCETEERVNCPPEDGPDYDFGAATILASNSAGRDILLAGQKSGAVFALDPDKGGEIIWQQKLGRGGIQGGVHFGMAVDGDTLYVPMSDFDGGPRWPGIAKPGMFALDITSGDTHWYTPTQDVCAGREFCQPGISAPASSLAGGVIAGAMDGHVRAYDGATGKILWDLDTAVEFDTLDGGRANGGSVGGASGPVLSGDMLFINSGYGIYFHMPGNVLLAYGLKKSAAP